MGGGGLSHETPWMATQGRQQPQEVVLQGLGHNFGYLLVSTMTPLMQSQLSNQVMTQFLYLGLQFLAIK